MAKYKGRAKRLSEAMDKIESIVTQLEEVKDSEEADDIKVTKANEIIDDVDSSEVEDLQGEMESWRDNLSGTNFENGEKYSRIEECIETLSNIVSDLQEISEVTDADGIDSIIDSLQEAVSEAGNADFPGMYN